MPRFVLATQILMNARPLLLLASLSAVACSTSDSEPESPTADILDDIASPPTTLADINEEADSIIDADSVDAILRQAVSVLNADALNRLDSALFALTAELNAQASAAMAGEAPTGGLDLLAQSTLTEAGAQPQRVELVFACDNDGTLTHVVADNAGGSPFDQRDQRFQRCALGDNDYNGGYTHLSGFRSDSVTRFDAFDIQRAQGHEHIDGSVTRAFSTNPSDALTWDVNRYEIVDTNTSLSLNDFTLERRGLDAPIANRGERYFVFDLDGIEREILEVDYSANLSASFTLSSAETAQAPVQVNAALNFTGNYFIWQTAGNPEVPSYPVSDLGTPLATKPGPNADNAPTRFVDQSPRTSDAQWQSGSVTLTAADGSSASLRPHPEDSALVWVELAGSMAPRNLDDGFQIDCPAIIAGCGATE